MKSMMKRSAVLISAAVSMMILGCIAIPAHAVTDDEATSAVLTEADITAVSYDYMRVIQLLGTDGVDIPVPTDANEQALMNLTEYAISKTDTQAEAASISGTSLSAEDADGQCSLTSMYSHAHEIAVSNMKRDSSARGEGAETVYMFLSHYVDLPRQYVGGGCSENDESQYLANWITDDDRNVYDSYLKVSNSASLTDDTLNTVHDVQSILKAPWSVINAWESLSEKRTFLNLYKAYKSTSSSANAIKKYGSLITDMARDLVNDENLNEENPEDVVKRIENRLSQQHYIDTSVSADDVVSLICSIASGKFFGYTMKKVGATLIKLNLKYLDGIEQTAAVAAMQASLSGRVSGRLMRYWGV